mmetsp:Transcript_8768/g.769  ORF Transcript_8768/g.769 Transcript_8768/m.769 type:complete len:81 (+) Transcript_8768:135-377(+)
MTYFATMVLFGLYVSSFGPLIIILSNKLNIPESEFSSIFITMGVGFITGSFLSGYCEGKMNLHIKYAIGCFLYLIFAISV